MMANPLELLVRPLNSFKFQIRQEIPIPGEEFPRPTDSKSKRGENELPRSKLRGINRKSS